MPRSFLRIVPTLICALLITSQAATLAGEAPEKPFLHGLFTDNMVFPRDQAAPVWGWTEPGKTVSVTMEGRTAEGTADSTGKWKARLGPFPAGGPYTLTVVGPGPVNSKGPGGLTATAEEPRSITLKNVLVGDVWVCSGQSNMEWGIDSVNDAKEEIARADHPQIRLFTVPKKIASLPESQVQGSWKVCNPETIHGFSAVGYFFGEKLNHDLKVPVGLINSSWGGTVAEAWTSAESLRPMEDFRDAVAQVEQQATDREKGTADFETQREAWWRKNDPGSAERLGWADPGFDSSSWKTMSLPQNWESGGLPGFDGVVWFRKEFEAPDSLGGKDLVLHLGPIDDFDTTWVNGVKVGGSDQWNTPREYKVPRDVVKPGRNVIAIRVLDTSGPGGLYGKPEQLKLEPAGDPKVNTVSLAGPWQYQESTPLTRLKSPPQAFGGNPNVVTVLNNGMIAPLVPFAIKGAIWYQGESNASRAAQYRALLPTLIRDWRRQFDVGDFPFFIVQLANYMERKPEPTDTDWARLREAQDLTTKMVPRTGLAVAIDIGDAGDIHPRNKQDVGRRLALSAEAIAYGQPVESSGPTFRASVPKGDAIQLQFDHVGGGLVAKGDAPLKGFAIAGEDRHFVWADAVIEGDSVVVSSPKVVKPVAVRYAWADNPECNLYNKAGLPAPPFRTDDEAK